MVEFILSKGVNPRISPRIVVMLKYTHDFESFYYRSVALQNVDFLERHNYPKQFYALVVPYFIFLRTVSENVRKPLAKLLKIS